MAVVYQEDFTAYGPKMAGWMVQAADHSPLTQTFHRSAQLINSV